MLLKKEKSCFVLVDVQEKLTPNVMNSDALIARCQWLMKLATRLHVPIIINEQYPQGLGKTVVPLRNNPAHACIQKVSFSCYQSPEFIEQITLLNKTQVVLAGIETHVCLLQTALDMHAFGFEVFVVADAVSSRHVFDHQLGLERMKQAGVQLLSAEMVFFEWVQRAGTPEFKSLSQEFLK